MKKYILIIFLIAVNISLSQGDIKTRVVAKNLDTPWEILWGPDNYIWMTERYGRISRVKPENGQVIPLITINDVFEDGERGLMGMVLHPDFANNPYLFAVYNYGNDNPSTKVRVIRYKYSDNKLIEPKIIIDNIQGWWNHDGSRLWISDDLKLFVTTGDASDPNRSQNLSNLNGKILRMNLDGSIPGDNPFPNSYVYSFGHRNPQGFVIANGKIYSSEHGPSTDDEINIILAGRNYGWPNVVGYCNTKDEIDFCQKNNVVEPLYSLTPQGTLAVAGMDYYNNNLIGEWKNSLLVTTLKERRLVQLKLNSKGDSVTERIDFFNGQYGRLRDLCISPDGRVFISTSNRDGRGSPVADDDRIIEISKDPVNSVNKKKDKSDFLIFPNPTTGMLNVELSETSEIYEISVYNLLGEKLLTLPVASTSVNLNLSDLKTENSEIGFYYVILQSKKGNYSEKILLIK